MFKPINEYPEVIKTKAAIVEAEEEISYLQNQLNSLNCRLDAARNELTEICRFKTISEIDNEKYLEKKKEIESLVADIEKFQLSGVITDKNKKFEQLKELLQAVIKDAHEQRIQDILNEMSTVRSKAKTQIQKTIDSLYELRQLAILYLNAKYPNQFPSAYPPWYPYFNKNLAEVISWLLWFSEEPKHQNVEYIQYSFDRFEKKGWPASEKANDYD